MRIFILLFLTQFLFTACEPKVEIKIDKEVSTEKVNQVLDDWHDAASVGDFERYFSHFASDSAIYIGTDATERWTVAEFREWSRPYFEDGMAWDFTPTFRKIYFSENGLVAWFDEELDTPNLGPSRGSGVLLRNENEEWNIAHYNLAIPIPNSIVDDVVGQIQEELTK